MSAATDARGIERIEILRDLMDEIERGPKYQVSGLGRAMQIIQKRAQDEADELERELDLLQQGGL